MPSDPIRVLLHVTELLERIGSPYFLGGSLASSMLGEPPALEDPVGVSSYRARKT